MILLTTPFTPGDVDPDHATYTHVEVDELRWSHRRKVFEIIACYGVVDGNGDFIAAPRAPQKIVASASARGGRYDAAIQGAYSLETDKLHPALPGYATFSAVARALDEWLIANGAVVGTVV